MSLEEGELVRVKGKHGFFTVKSVVEGEDGILGYNVSDKDLMNHCYRVDVVSPKKKKRKRKGRG